MFKFFPCFTIPSLGLLLAITLSFSQDLGSGLGQNVPTMEPLELELLLEPENLAEVDSGVLQIYTAIPPGWHINSPSPLDEFSLPLRLDLEAKGLEFGEPQFPEPEIKYIEALKSKASMYSGDVFISVPIYRISGKTANLNSITVTLHYQACSDKICLPPESVTAGMGKIPQPSSEQAKQPPEASSLSKKPDQPEGDGFDFEANLLVVILGLLLSGLALNLTPCVYPMIAITISLFGGQKASLPRRLTMASLYVLGMVLSFSALGVFAALSGNLFGSFLQSPAVQIAIVVIFLVLALWSFGLFEVRLPAGLMGKAMNASNVGGYAGGFLAGLFVGVLAAPCIGPIVLSLLLHVANTGSIWTGWWMFAVLAVGMGIPYIILGGSSTMIQKLPRSGDWLNDVKKVLGVILLLLALYYARGFLSEKVYELVFGGLLVYLALYINPFSEKTKVSKWLSTLLNTVAFVVLLYGGFTIAQAILGTQWQKGIQQVGQVSGKASSAVVWSDYSEKKLIEAQKQNEWVLIDFQSKIWCAACREMEEKTFVDPEVREKLKSMQLLTVDVDKHPDAKQLQKEYQVRGIPTLILIGPLGNERGRVVGFVPPDEFLARLETSMGA